MGRRGGGGGGRSSGGGGRSRSSGGRSRSSGRSGGSSFGGGGGHSSHYRSARTNTYVRTTVVSPSYTRRYGRSSVSGGVDPASSAYIIFGAILAIFLITTVLSMITAGPNISNNKNRTKISSGYSFMNDCVYDDIDWIDSTSTLRNGMEYFYDKTGVQPVIILHEYEPTMSESQMEDNTVALYDEMFGSREDVFLYVYYDSAPTASEDGYDTWCIGMQAMSVMDDDALDIFWQWLDHYWYGNTYASGEEDEMFAAIYKDTANSIMEKSTTGLDVAFVGFIAVIVIAAGVTIVVLVKAKHKRKKEEAEETARILNADLDTLSSASEDDLVNKYN